MKIPNSRDRAVSGRFDDWRIALLSVLLSILVISCSVPEQISVDPSPTASPITDSSTQLVLARETQAVVIDGSSTVYPISVEASKRFQRRNRTSEFAVNFSGTGGGFKRFCNNETDINNASRPILEKELATCSAGGVKFVEIPIAFDALSIVAHPDNNWVEAMTVAELKKVWEAEAEGKITNWNQIRSGWPDRPLKLFGRGQDSGTYDYFTEVIVGEQGKIRSDYTASEDVDSLVEQIRKEPNALGFFGIGHYVKNWEDLKAIAVDSGSGPVYPSLDAVRTAQYRPLSRPLFLYVNAESLQTKPQVQPFLENYLRNLRNWVTLVGYMPLKDKAYNLALQRLQKREVGTAFGGKIQTNMTIEEALRGK